MESVRIGSIGPPFSRAPGAAALGFDLLIRAEAMGLLPEGVEGETRLDSELLTQLADSLVTAGIAVGPAQELGQARGKRLEAALHAVLEALDGSPYPPGEWAPARELLGDDLLAVLVGGISASSLRRYATGERETPDEVAWRLHVLARILGALRGAYNEYGMRRWFERPRVQLDGKTPGAVLLGASSENDPGVEEVIDLAEALAGPGFAT
jgi:hypothetical protein